METENKIIKQFIEKKQPKTIRELSKEIKSDYKITHTAITRLIKKNIISSKIIGKSRLCSLNNYYGIEIYKAENERRNSILNNSNIKQLVKELKLKTSFYILLLFGSYAKNKQTNTSDIDLMFISNENNFEKNLQEILSTLPLKIHTITLTEKDFIRMKNSEQKNVVKEAIKNNIILYGIENYYKLKDAR